MQSYNGWTGAQRTSRGNEHNAAMRMGTCPRPGACDICGQTHNTMWHAEHYGPTFEAYLASCKPLCGHCHAMLHLRFKFPNRWAHHLILASRGPVEYVTSMGTIFMRSNSWQDFGPPARPVTGEAWYYQLPAAA